VRHVIMHRDRGVINGRSDTETAGGPSGLESRRPTSSPCSMFLSSTAAGGEPARIARRSPSIVLSKRENETLFGGSNSVGRTIRWNDVEFRIVGVPGRLVPASKILRPSPETPSPHRRIPISPSAGPKHARDGSRRRQPTIVGATRQRTPSKTISTQTVSGFRCGSSCRTPRARERMRTFLDSYWGRAAQGGAASSGRAINRLTDVKTVAPGPTGRRERRSYPRRPRVRVPRRVPDQHRRAAAGQVPEWSSADGRPPRHSGLAAGRCSFNIWSRPACSPQPARCSVSCSSAAGPLGLAYAVLRGSAVRLHRLPGSGALRYRKHRDSGGPRRRRGNRRRHLPGVARRDVCPRPCISRVSEVAEMSLNIRPILSSLLCNRTGAVLVALQIALALAILVNATYIVKQRVDSNQTAPTGYR